MKTFAITTLAVAGLAIAANADTINATFNGISPSQSADVVLNSNNYSVPAGAFQWTRDLGNPGTLAGFSPTFTTFCIDLTQVVNVGTTYAFEDYTIDNAPTSGLGAMGPVRGNYMARLFADHYTGLATSDDYAGFQLAVWEIAFDGDLSLVTGNFTVAAASAGALSRANTFLGTVGSAGPTWAVFAIDDLPGTQGVQGQVLIPTPGAAALIGLGALAAGRRRR